MTRQDFDLKQKELSDKIKLTEANFLHANTSAEDKEIYARQIKILTGLKKRNATIFKSQLIQLNIL